MQTWDEETDLARLRQIVEIMKKHPGEDRVRMVINGDEEAVKVELPEMRIQYSPRLHQQLAELVGEENLTFKV
jgi:hypothetical protein